MRVVTRTVQRVGRLLGGAAVRVRNRLRSVGHHCFAIARAARRAGDEPVRRCRQLMAATRAVLRDADTAVRRMARVTLSTTLPT